MKGQSSIEFMGRRGVANKLLNELKSSERISVLLPTYFSKKIVVYAHIVSSNIIEERKSLKKEGEIYSEVEYSKKVEKPECPYKCKGCKDKQEYIVCNGKAKERIIKARKVGTQRIYLIHRPQRYMCKKTGKSFRNEKISYRWQRITRAEKNTL